MSHTLAPFADLRLALRAGGFLELVRSPFPGAEERFLSLASLRGGGGGAKADAAARLDAWLREVVQLAKWGCLPAPLVAQVTDLVHFDPSDAAAVLPVAAAAETSPETEARRPEPPPRFHHHHHAGRGGQARPRRSQSCNPSPAAPAAGAPASHTPTTTPPLNNDGDEAARRIAELESLVRLLKSQLDSSSGAAEGQSLEALEDELRRLARVLLEEGDASVEAELEALDAAIKKHPDYAERLARANAAWEEAQAPLNAAALRRTRRLVPRDVHSSTARRVHATFAAAAAATGGPPQDAKRLRAFANAAKRVWSNQALWLAWLPADRLHTLHPADLRGRFAPHNGLDITEVRAIYAALPPAFDNDPKGLKLAWRDQIRARLRDLAHREAQGALAAREVRHGAYAEVEAAGPEGGIDINDFLLPPEDEEGSSAPQKNLLSPPRGKQQNHSARRAPSAGSAAAFADDERDDDSGNATTSTGEGDSSPDAAAAGRRKHPLLRRATTGSLLSELESEKNRAARAPAVAKKIHPPVKAVRAPPPNLLAAIQRKKALNTADQ